MSGEAGGGSFLGRWSRLKEEARARVDEPQAAPAPASSDVPSPEAGPPELPSVDSLGLDSDYRPFLQPKVEEHLRRTALKKLFSDPHFNVMDGLDVYIDDYSVSEPLSEAMLAQLEQAKNILAWSREDAEARARQEAGEQRLAAAPAQETLLPETPAVPLPDAAAPESPLQAGAEVPEPRPPE